MIIGPFFTSQQPLVDTTNRDDSDDESDTEGEPEDNLQGAGVPINGALQKGRKCMFYFRILV